MAEWACHSGCIAPPVWQRISANLAAAPLEAEREFHMRRHLLAECLPLWQSDFPNAKGALSARLDIVDLCRSNPEFGGP